MANTKQAIKRVRQQEKRYLRNRTWRNEIKSAKRALLDALRTGEDEGISNAVNTLQKKVDKSAQRGVIHSNKAARIKAHYAKLVNAK